MLYIQKRQWYENKADCAGGGGGGLPWFYQLTVPAVGAYSRGLKNEKSKSPLFPGGNWGSRLQMTSALAGQVSSCYFSSNYF